MDAALTLAGFIALASLTLAAIGFAFSASSRSAALRERVARLEAQLDDHVRNGRRHD